jgi:hypothetical protein
MYSGTVRHGENTRRVHSCTLFAQPCWCVCACGWVGWLVVAGLERQWRIVHVRFPYLSTSNVMVNARSLFTALDSCMLVLAAGGRWGRCCCCRRRDTRAFEIVVTPENHLPSQIRGECVCASRHQLVCSRAALACLLQSLTLRSTGCAMAVFVSQR